MNKMKPGLTSKFGDVISRREIRKYVKRIKSHGKLR